MKIHSDAMYALAKLGDAIRMVEYEFGYSATVTATVQVAHGASKGTLTFDNEGAITVTEAAE